jgi:hypothetical protein
MDEQTEAAGFENTSIPAAQGTTGEGYTGADKHGWRMLICVGTKEMRLLDRA